LHSTKIKYLFNF